VGHRMPAAGKLQAAQLPRPTEDNWRDPEGIRKGIHGEVL